MESFNQTSGWFKVVVSEEESATELSLADSKLPAEDTMGSSPQACPETTFTEEEDEMRTTASVGESEDLSGMDADNIVSSSNEELVAQTFNLDPKQQVAGSCPDPKNSGFLEQDALSSTDTAMICEFCGNTPILLSRKLFSGEVRSYTCNSCGCTLTMKGNMWSICPVPGRRLYVCRKCGKLFSSSKGLSNHIQIDCCVQSFVCQFCNRGFSQRRYLIPHRISHIKERLHLSEEDEQNSAPVVNVNQREFSGNGGNEYGDESFYICPFCGKIFREVKGLTEHLNMHAKEVQLMCGVCGKTFSHFPSLKDHEVSHDRQTLILCDICGWRVFCEDDLHTHKLIHTGEKPYLCEVCGQCFCSLSLLRTHKFIHTGEKPCVCEACGKGFTERNLLTKHSYTHSSDPPYACYICGMTFIFYGHYVLHLRKHKGDDCHQCSICRETFTKQYELFMHIMGHSSEKHFKCVCCKKSFPFVWLLEKRRFSRYQGYQVGCCSTCC